MLKFVHKKPHKPFTYEDVILYRLNKEAVEEVKQKALKILKKSKHFEFFERNLYIFREISDYDAFSFADNMPYADEMDSMKCQPFSKQTDFI